MPAFSRRAPQDTLHRSSPHTRSVTRSQSSNPQPSPAEPRSALRPTFALRGSDSRDSTLDIEQLLGLRPQVNASVFVSAEEAAEMECNITLASYAELTRPVALRSHGVLHLFEYADFMRHWRERGTNPCTRQQVEHSELMNVRVAELTAHAD